MDVSTRTLGVGVASALLLSATLPAMAQTTRMQTQQASQTRASDTNIGCIATVLHFAENGFAFECVDQRNQAEHLFVVKAQGNSARVEMVVAALKEHNARSTGSGRTRGMEGLWVSFRSPDATAQSVCNKVTPRYGSARCAIAVDIAFR